MDNALVVLMIAAPLLQPGVASALWSQGARAVSQVRRRLIERPVKQLPTEPGDICIICFDELGPDAGLTHCRWGCGRALHAECMDKWLLRRNDCVFCQARGGREGACGPAGRYILHGMCTQRTPSSLSWHVDNLRLLRADGRGARAEVRCACRCPTLCLQLVRVCGACACTCVDGTVGLEERARGAAWAITYFGCEGMYIEYSIN
eukprot:scaffold27315_cov63-Phaeocystis_antarctica.AAC.1